MIRKLTLMLIFWPALLMADYGWFLCPYKPCDQMPVELRLDGETNCFYCPMQDYYKQINADKGSWSETMIDGNQAIVKVKASSTTLDLLTVEFYRFPFSDKLETINSKTSSDIDAMKVYVESVPIVTGQAVVESAVNFNDVLTKLTQARRDCWIDSKSGLITYSTYTVKAKQISVIENEVK